MADQRNIEAHYDLIGPLHALRISGDYPDYTCALFDGDSSKSLIQAQRDKHRWIFDELGLGQDLSDRRILDIGCGWGPILNAVRERGGTAIGLTLSPGQVAYCTSRGLDARLRNYKDLRPGELGTFDGIISIGAIEHFCSIDEHLSGRQDDVYRDFFARCAAMLRLGGRLFVQSMTWGKRVPDYRRLSLNAPRDSEELILARMEKLYPNSWPTSGLEQMQRCAANDFTFLTSKNGRLDYLETLKHWGRENRNLYRWDRLPQALAAGTRLLANAAVNPDTRVLISSVWWNDQRTCFKREIMSHERMFFEKK